MASGSQIMALKQKLQNSQGNPTPQDLSLIVNSIDELSKKIDLIMNIVLNGFVPADNIGKEETNQTSTKPKKTSRKTEDFIPSVDFSKSKVNMSEKSKIDKTSIDDAVDKMNNIKS